MFHRVKTVHHWKYFFQTLKKKVKPSRKKQSDLFEHIKILLASCISQQNPSILHRNEAMTQKMDQSRTFSNRHLISLFTKTRPRPKKRFADLGWKCRQESTIKRCNMFFGSPCIVTYLLYSICVYPREWKMIS